jgi:glutathionylspermidine synthase
MRSSAAISIRLDPSKNGYSANSCLDYKQAYGKMIMNSKALSTLCNFIAEECDSKVRYLFKMFLESADAASKEGESSIGLTTIEEVLERKR